MHKLAGLGLSATSLALLPGCGMLSPAAQPAKVARIGWLTGASAAWSAPYLEAFREGLRELGYLDGQNVLIEERYPQGGADALATVAAELVALPADLVVTYGTPPTQAVKQASPTIPIVFASSADPVGTGLVASLARPGGNATGFSNLALEIIAKRLQLLMEASPGATHVAVLWNPANPAQVVQWKELQAAASPLGVRLQSLEARTIDEIESAFATMMRERPDALLTTGDPFLLGNVERIVEFAERIRLPAMYQSRENAVVAGGLMAYGPNLPDLFRRAATYVDKILKGARPADLPVEQPTRFDFVINLKTAQTLGLTIPQSVLMQATEVVQ